MVGNERADVCRHGKALRTKPFVPMTGRECLPKRERKSAILRAETDEAQPVLQKEKTEFDAAIWRPEHIFDASLHILTTKFKSRF
tara:strand:- start:258 stop:512 length:255 start_codon:yes stop_codon:yes gene_type:complete